MIENLFINNKEKKDDSVSAGYFFDVTVEAKCHGISLLQH